MNKKFFQSTFLALSVVLPVFLVGGSNEQQSIEQNSQNVALQTRNIASDNLRSDIEDLSFSIDLYNETVNYDITFKNNAFNGTKVNSFFYYANGDAEYMSYWRKTAFDGSTETVKSRKASNHAAYHEQLFTLYADPNNHLLNHNGTMSLGVLYEKDGEMISATENWIEFNIFDENLIEVDQANTKMKVNDDKTFAEIAFNLDFNDIKMSPNEIALKSHSDNHLNQIIFTNEKYSLIQGENKINIRLLENYEYKDLYLAFTFDNYRGGQYLFSSEFNSKIAFTSGSLSSWDGTSIALLSITLILILVMIIFVVLLLRLMKRRKDLEKLDDLEYLEKNY